VLCVDQTADGNNDGTSWEDAYTDLQTALQAVRDGYDLTPDDPIDDVAEIWVARGVYKPYTGTAPDDQNASFELVQNLGIFGGFYGTETKQSQRNPDPVQNGTVLSGDLGDNDAVSIEEDRSSFEDNSHTVVFAGDTIDQTAVLDGFMITGGFNTVDNGGGAYIKGLPTLKNLFVRNNAAAEGGGGLAINAQQPGDLIITDCIFDGNVADYIGDRRGGGIWSSGDSQGTNYRLILRNCIFRDNTAHYGGGLYVDNQKLSLKRCTFTANNAIQGTDGGWGGGMRGHYAQIDMDQCKFIGNDAEYSGGGIFLTGNCQIEITQSVIAGNTSYSSGAGLVSSSDTAFGPGRREIWVINSVFADNTCSGGCGITMFESNSSLQVENSIFWGNEGWAVAWQIWTSSFNRVKTSNIQYGSTVYQGYGNIFEDPLMVNAATGDVRLGNGSPCIDAGNSYVDFEPMTRGGFTLLPDLDPAGNPRVADGNGDGVAEVDMGVYEYQ